MISYSCLNIHLPTYKEQNAFLSANVLGAPSEPTYWKTQCHHALETASSPDIVPSSLAYSSFRPDQNARRSQINYKPNKNPAGLTPWQKPVTTSVWNFPRCPGRDVQLPGLM